MSLTITEKILISAVKVQESKGAGFSAEDLVVESWRLYPESFGLQGYARKYPDSNRVLTKLMSSAKSSLRSRGLLEKTGQKRYRVTDAGMLAAEALLDSEEPAVAQRGAGLTRESIETLTRLVDSRAYELARSGVGLRFGDACGFWNISARSTAAQLAARRAETAAALKRARELVSDNRSLKLPSGELLGVADVERLSALDEKLAQEFATELEVIEGRTDGRRTKARARIK